MGAATSNLCSQDSRCTQVENNDIIWINPSDGQERDGISGAGAIVGFRAVWAFVGGGLLPHRWRPRAAEASARPDWPLCAIPYPAILSLKEGGFAVLGAGSTKGMVRLVDPIARTAQELSVEDIAALFSGELILITRRFGGAGADPTTFGFRWF